MVLKRSFIILFSLLLVTLSCVNQEEKSASTEKSTTVEAKAPEVNSNKSIKAVEPVRKSPREVAKYVDRDFNVILKYGSPRVNDRKI